MSLESEFWVWFLSLNSELNCELSSEWSWKLSCELWVEFQLCFEFWVWVLSWCPEFDLSSEWWITWRVRAKQWQRDVKENLLKNDPCTYWKQTDLLLSACLCSLLSWFRIDLCLSVGEKEWKCSEIREFCDVHSTNQLSTQPKTQTQQLNSELKLRRQDSIQ